MDLYILPEHDACKFEHAQDQLGIQPEICTELKGPADVEAKLWELWDVLMRIFEDDPGLYHEAKSWLATSLANLQHVPRHTRLEPFRPFLRAAAPAAPAAGGGGRRARSRSRSRSRSRGRGERGRKRRDRSRSRSRGRRGRRRKSGSRERSMSRDGRSHSRSRSRSRRRQRQQGSEHASDSDSDGPGNNNYGNRTTGQRGGGSGRHEAGGGSGGDTAAVQAQLLQLVLEERPRDVGELLVDCPEVFVEFFKGSDLRIMLWFSHFSMAGMSGFKYGAYALAHYALVHRDQMWDLLVWEGKHPQAPVAVATKTHYFCELNVLATVHNLLDHCPHFWTSEQWRACVVGAGGGSGSAADGSAAGGAGSATGSSKRAAGAAGSLAAGRPAGAALASLGFAGGGWAGGGGAEGGQILMLDPGFFCKALASLLQDGSSSNRSGLSQRALRLLESLVIDSPWRLLCHRLLPLLPDAWLLRIIEALAQDIPLAPAPAAASTTSGLASLSDVRAVAGGSGRCDLSALVLSRGARWRSMMDVVVLHALSCCRSQLLAALREDDELSGARLPKLQRLARQLHGPGCSTQVVKAHRALLHAMRSPATSTSSRALLALEAWSLGLALATAAAAEAAPAAAEPASASAASAVAPGLRLLQLTGELHGVRITPAATAAATAAAGGATAAAAPAGAAAVIAHQAPLSAPGRALPGTMHQRHRSAQAAPAQQQPQQQHYDLLPSDSDSDDRKHRKRKHKKGRKRKHGSKGSKRHRSKGHKRHRGGSSSSNSSGDDSADGDDSSSIDTGSTSGSEGERVERKRSSSKREKRKRHKRKQAKAADSSDEGGNGMRRDGSDNHGSDRDHGQRRRRREDSTGRGDAAAASSDADSGSTGDAGGRDAAADAVGPLLEVLVMPPAAAAAAGERGRQQQQGQAQHEPLVMRAGDAADLLACVACNHWIQAAVLRGQ